MRRLAFVGMGMWAGCGGGTAECGPAECADVCAHEAATPEAAPAPAPETSPKEQGLGELSPFEKGLLTSYVEDVKAGVRPYDEQGFGICKGKGRECPEFLGAKVGDLPEGEYMIQARLKVPQLGDKETWKVVFATSCETIKVGADGQETRKKNDHSKEYATVYPGPDHPYRLAPLHVIKSPAKGGRQECTYTLTAKRPDGDKVFEGSYAVPAAE